MNLVYYDEIECLSSPRYYFFEQDEIIINKDTKCNMSMFVQILCSNNCSSFSTVA